jgi:TusA-related sulfurtransferase
VCGATAEAAHGDDVPAAAPRGATRGAHAEGDALPAGALDLRTETCPMNLLRARRAVERLGAGETLEIRLGREGAATVPDGLATQGHVLLAREPRGEGLRLLVRRGEGTTAPSPPRAEGDAWLRRFARQIVMPDVGEAGQRRLGAATVLVAGRGDAAVAAVVYLAAAGVGTLVIGVEGEVGARAGRWPLGDAAPSDALRRALARRVTDAGGAALAIEDARGGTLAGATVAAFAGRAPVVPTHGRRPWVALAPGGGGVVVRAGPWPAEAWVDLPPSALEGPVGFAAGALLADAAMRRVLGFARAGSVPVLRLDGTLEDRRAAPVTSAGC